VDVTVITPTLPERSELLRECVASVEAQTFAPAAHLIVVDSEREGTGATLNKLWPGVKTEWVAVLADDDLIDPHHLQTLLGMASLVEYEGQAHIVYSYCRVTGRKDGWNPNRPFSAWGVRQGTHPIPATALIRRSLIERVGGWRDPEEGYEDQDFWKRALDVEARFVCVRRITWTYRFHGQNVSAVNNPRVMAALTPP
jgi:glycosyltransferase involved in cell wall biosynthesis